MWYYGSCSLAGTAFSISLMISRVTSWRSHFMVSSVSLSSQCLNEKRDENAHQFRLLLNWIKEGALGQRSFMSVLNLAARHQEY